MKLQIIAKVHGKTYVSSVTEAFDSIEDCQKALLKVPDLVMKLDEEDSGLSTSSRSFSTHTFYY